MMPTMRCPDCGGWTTLRLCDDCAQVATLLGVTVGARLKMLKAGAE